MLRTAWSALGWVFESVTQPRLVPEYVAGMGIAITDLTPVEQTAFVTQYARAVDSRWPRPILGDTLADDIVAKIDYDFDGLGVPASAIRQTALRAKLLDDRARRFIAEHPDAVVVDLGAGLATPMQRVAPPPTVDWYNVDLPNVIALREQVVPADDHAHSVAASLADDSWTDQIPADRPTMLIADGLLAFVSEALLVNLFRHIPEHFRIRRSGDQRLRARQLAEHRRDEDRLQCGRESSGTTEVSAIRTSRRAGAPGCGWSRRPAWRTCRRSISTRPRPVCRPG